MHRNTGFRIQDLGYSFMKNMGYKVFLGVGIKVGETVEVLGDIVHKLCTNFTPSDLCKYLFGGVNFVPALSPLYAQANPQERLQIKGFGGHFLATVHSMHRANNNNEVIYKDL